MFLERSPIATLIANAATAQNCVGLSIKDVKKLINEKGYITESGVTKEENTYYITGEDNVAYRIYYFDDSNRCFLTALYLNDTTEDEHKEQLTERGYLQFEDAYYKDDLKAIILYNEELKRHYLILVEK